MIPSHLYHYTSLETLLLILENNTFRFNRLDRMNDPLDGHNDLDSEYRKCVFSSSWTAQKKDKLPMWNMYKDLKGVRLKMPIDLFNYSDNLIVKKLNKGNNYLITSKLNKPYTIQQKETAKEIFINTIFGPTKVDYCSRISTLSKGLVEIREDIAFPFHEINLNLFGQKKINDWSFEKEYRFRIFYGDGIMLASSEGLWKETFDKHPISTNSIDVEFKPEALENIEIILGPKSDEDAKSKIEEVLKSRNIKKFIIKKSEIRIN